MAREARGLEALACVTRPVANHTAILRIPVGSCGQIHDRTLLSRHRHRQLSLECVWLPTHIQILSGLAGAAVVAAPAIANAEVEYPNVPYLGGSDTVLVRAS